PTGPVVLLLAIRAFLFLSLLLPPTSTLFPYTTLFRSAAWMEARHLAGFSEQEAARYFGQPRTIGLPQEVLVPLPAREAQQAFLADRKSTRLNSSHVKISYAVFCLKKKNRT